MYADLFSYIVVRIFYNILGSFLLAFPHIIIYEKWYAK